MTEREIAIDTIIRDQIAKDTNQLDARADRGRQPVALGYAIKAAAEKIAARYAAFARPTRDKVSYLLPEKGTVLAINADSAREALQTFLNTFVFKDGAKCVVDRVDHASNGGLAILFHSAPIEKEES